jgi:hypothetical protein
MLPNPGNAEKTTDLALMRLQGAGLCQKFAGETSIRMAQRLFQRLSAASGGTSKLREALRPSKNATNGLLKLTSKLWQEWLGLKIPSLQLGSRRESSAAASRGFLEGGSRGRPGLEAESTMLWVNNDLHAERTRLQRTAAAHVEGKCETYYISCISHRILVDEL